MHIIFVPLYKNIVVNALFSRTFVFDPQSGFLANAGFTSRSGGGGGGLFCAIFGAKDLEVL